MYIYIYFFFFFFYYYYFFYLFGLFWGKMVAGHVTAHLMDCWHAWEIWGCVTILALSLDGVPDQSILPVHQLF